jgi:N6-adenosine-specific RNA methylase IME4
MVQGLTYRCIVVDPPWQVNGAGRPMSGGPGSYLDWSTRVESAPSRPLPYRTMTIAQISALPVGALADAQGAHLYLWTTNRHLGDAFGVLAAWGFAYSTTLVWAKKPMGGGLGGAYGISTEYVIFARRGTLATDARITGTWFPWKRPYDERGKPKHSAKPPEFYSMVETVSPGPRIELFARSARAGWSVWGDQAPDAVPCALDEH